MLPVDEKCERQARFLFAFGLVFPIRNQPRQQAKLLVSMFCFSLSLNEKICELNVREGACESQALSLVCHFKQFQILGEIMFLWFAGIKVGQRLGFTLIELLVTVAIIGVLIGLLLPAAQSVRESSRRVTCQNKLRQQSLGLLAHESAQRAFPFGSTPSTRHSWATKILPFLEQDAVSRQFDFDKPWDETGNFLIAETPLTIFNCPSSRKEFMGKTDYSGISGSLRFPGGSRNGVLLLSPDAQTRWVLGGR